jgi:two-component system, cell cycle sensor histidine kinase and response regulator CckA
MISKFLSLPIRIHLVILISLLAFPFIILIIYSGIVERSEAINNAKQESLKFVSIIATEQQSLVAGIEQLVTALSFIPELQSRNITATNDLLVDLLRKNPQLTNIAVMDKTGLIWGTAAPFAGKVSLGDRKYFIDAVRTGKFSSGEYTIGRISKKPIINFGYPVKDRSNRLIAVIGIAIDLEYIQRNFKKMNLPLGSSFSILDHKGVILNKDREDDLSERPAKNRNTRKDIFNDMKDGADEGTFEAMGNDGNFSLFAYKKISLTTESKPYLYICSNIPRYAATSRANAAMFKNMAALMLLLFAGDRKSVV